MGMHEHTHKFEHRIVYKSASTHKSQTEYSASKATIKEWWNKAKAWGNFVDGKSYAQEL